MIFKTIRAIKNYFTDQPQDKELKIQPLAKIEAPKLYSVEVHARESIELVNEMMKPRTIQMPPENLKQELGFYKDAKIKERAKYLHPEVANILLEMVDWIANELNLHPMVTETVTTKAEDEALKPPRKSSTHREGRAFDLRTRDWNGQQIARFQNYFNSKYAHLGAITTSGKPLLLLHHDSGHGDHFHVQFNKAFTASTPRGIA